MELLRDRVVGLSGEELLETITHAFDELAKRVDERSEPDMERWYSRLHDLEQRMAWLEGAMEVQSLIDQRIDRLAAIVRRLPPPG